MHPDFLHLFAQHLGTDPAQAADALSGVTDALGTALKHTGRADIAGLGAFRVVKGHVAFVPAVEVANEVNARYAGLEDVAPPPQASFPGAEAPARASETGLPASSPPAPEPPAPEPPAPVSSDLEDAGSARAERSETGTNDPVPEAESGVRSAPEADDFPSPLPALSLADLLREDVPDSEPAGEQPYDEWEGVWAPAAEPNAQPLAPSTDAGLEDAQFDVVAGSAPPPELPVEDVAVEPVEMPGEAETAADPGDGLDRSLADEPEPLERAEDTDEELSEARDERMLRKKKKRVKAVVVSRDFLRERDAERRAALEQQRRFGPVLGPAEAPEPLDSSGQALEEKSDYDLPDLSQDEPDFTVPPAVAALRTPPSVPRDRRRVPERRQEKNWLLPALLAGLVVLGLLAWSASGPDRPAEAPPPDRAAVALPEPAPDAVTTAPEAPPAEAPVAPADPFDAPLVGVGGIDADRGGFTWVVTRAGRPPSAQAAAYTSAGYRAGVLRSASGGQPVERVCLGQFRTADEAMAAQSDLPEDVPSDRWLLRISS